MPDSDPIESVLTSIKKVLNIPADVTVFDPDIIMHINTAFAKLHQLGVGPSDGFSIVDEEAEWGDFLTELPLNMVRTYVYLEVRLVFDPPTASVLTAMEKQRDELVWRLSVAAEDLREGVSFA